jgi:GMP synthase (glutamine-hydrolysing)
VSVPTIQTGIQTEIEKTRIQTLQEADFLVRMQCEQLDLECKHIWQFPVVLAPIFVEGKEAIILRPIESENAMTANFAILPKVFLDEITEKLLALQNISQVYFDLTHKPPGTIEWE